MLPPRTCMASLAARANDVGAWGRPPVPGTPFTNSFRNLVKLDIAVVVPWIPRTVPSPATPFQRSTGRRASLTSPVVSVARSLERRLEKLIEGVAGRVFSGKIHPSELAGQLAREADFARFQHPTGPATGNLYVIAVSPRDLTIDPGELEAILTDEMTDYTTEEGLRLEGPVAVRVETTNEASSGRAQCHVEVAPGPPVVWARMVGDDETLPIGRNRVLIGRSPEADVVIGHDDVSRKHALLYRERGQTWLQDLSSANGTWVEGRRLGSEPGPVEQGSIVTVSEHRYRFVEI